MIQKIVPTASSEESLGFKEQQGSYLNSIPPWSLIKPFFAREDSI